MTPRRLALHALLGALAVSAPAAARPYECSQWTHIPAHLANASRGDILLTRVDGSPAGAVTDPLGQHYTHAGIMTSPASVRHNTSLFQDPKSTLEGVIGDAVLITTSLGDSDICYGWARMRNDDFRKGMPGFGNNSMTELPGLKPWNMNHLHLLKPSNETYYRDNGYAAAAAAESMLGQTYDVYSYRSYDEAISLNRSMCSGSVKRSFDVAGVRGFTLNWYTAAQVNTSAVSLYHYIYNLAHAKINQKSYQGSTIFGDIHALTWRCREKMAAAIANQVVSCFADGTCNPGSVKMSAASANYWATRNIGSALSISPDNLLNQPRSGYGPVVGADYRPAAWGYQRQTCQNPRAQIGDYDGDGKSDLTVWRPSNGTWYVLTPGGQTYVQQWGTVGDVPFSADLNGDKRSDYTVWRPPSGVGTGVTFSYFTSGNQGGMGAAHVVPVALDADGDFKDEYAYYDPALNQFFYRKPGQPFSIADAANTTNMAGLTDEIPVPGDYDGDNRSDFAVYSRSQATFSVRFATGAVLEQRMNVGASPASSWIAVPGDYDGDLKTDYAVYNRDTGEWQVLLAAGGSLPSYFIGSPGHIPIPGDYDGDGKTDMGIYNPEAFEFVIRLNASRTVLRKYWGTTGDLPVLGRY